MLITDLSMPDGELRIYCTRIASVISYFVDDGEGGSALITEPSDTTVWQRDVMDGVLSDLREHIIDEVASRLRVNPTDVETLPIEALLAAVDEKPKPRHPWEVRTKTHARRMAR